MRTNTRPAPSKPVLLVEDDENDALLVQAAFQAVGVCSPLVVVEDGWQALDYLAGRGQYTERNHFPFPRLVLLDLKLPGMPGFEVLSWIRSQKGISSLTVVVLSSSSQEVDVQEAYARGANAYLVKPSGVENLVEMVRAIDSFWLRQNRQLTLKLWEFSGIPDP